MFPDREYLFSVEVYDYITDTEALHQFNIISAEEGEQTVLIEIVSDADATGYLDLSQNANNVFKAKPTFE